MTEVVADGQSVARAKELAAIYLTKPEVDTQGHSSVLYPAAQARTGPINPVMGSASREPVPARSIKSMKTGK